MKTEQDKINELANWETVKSLCRPASITGSYAEEYAAYCESNGYPHDITVAAGDRVDIVFSRVNTPHITAYPTVTYQKITSEAIKTDDAFSSSSVSALGLDALICKMQNMNCKMETTVATPARIKNILSSALLKIATTQTTALAKNCNM